VTGPGRPAEKAPQASSPSERLDSTLPSLTSTMVNDACWKFVEAMPHRLPGPIFNDLKPALYAAFQHLYGQMDAAFNAAILGVAENTGLLGPRSRVGDSHEAALRFGRTLLALACHQQPAAQGASPDAPAEAIAVAVEAERAACIDIVKRRTGIPLDALKRGTGVRDHLVIAGEQIMRAIADRGAASAAPADGRGTDAQILKEREIARHAIAGALAAGYAGQPHPGPDHWLAAAHDAGAQIKALEATQPAATTPHKA